MLRQLRLIPVYALALAALASAAYFTRARWQPLFWAEKKPAEEGPHHDQPPAERVRLTPQARENLKLVVKPAALKKTHWRTTSMPGVVVDRPGQSDRGVTAPITGVVSKIHAFPSDTVRPGDPLFDLRITSEFVQNAQVDLFKAVKEAQLQDKVVKRLEASRDTVAEGQIIDARGQQSKLAAQVRSLRQILQSRGLTTAQIDDAAEGTFVREVTVVTPSAGPGRSLPTAVAAPEGSAGPAYEVQELKAQLGEQVQAGQVLGVLANHALLYIEGRAFKSESALLAQAAQNGREVEAEFSEDGGDWPERKQTLAVRHLANTVDHASRTFAFYVPLTNQGRAYQKEGKTFLVWRYRPGQRVRLHVPAEPFKDVIVLPAEAVVREGPEAYVFRANGDAFDRKPVTVLYEDRREVVLSNDGSLPPGLSVAHNAAAALNRVLKAQQTGGEGHDHHHHH